MSDGARCHYCRKVPCVCHNKAEPPSPMERLEAWMEGSVDQRFAELGTGDKYRCVLTDWTGRSFTAKFVASAHGPTLDAAITAAITAALEQAGEQGGDRGL